MNNIVDRVRQLTPSSVWPRARANIELFDITDKGYELIENIWFNPSSLDFVFGSKIHAILSMTEPQELDSVGKYLYSRVGKVVALRYELFVEHNLSLETEEKQCITVLHVAFTATVAGVGQRRYFAPKTRGYNALLQRLHDDPRIPAFSKQNPIIDRLVAPNTRLPS